MKDHIRIYYNSKCIFIANNAKELIGKEGLQNAWIYRKKDDLLDCFHRFRTSAFDFLIVEGATNELFPQFLESFELIMAGGGLVWNNENELLMIHRLGKWDLPKGKLDPGEEIAECAVREVEEETGLRNISLKSFLKSTFHIYNLKDQWIVKQTEWYEMHATKQNLIPQQEEDISEAVWVPKVDIAEKLENSYPNIIFLLDESL